jgi:drug/metabolite transporter (DMT)-like permease
MSAPESQLGVNTPSDSFTQSMVFVFTGVLFSALWSSAFIAGKAGLEAAPPLYLLAARFLFAGVLMIMMSSFFVDWRPRGTDARQMWFLAFALGLLNNVLYLGMSFYALLSLPAGLVVLILSTAPIITAVIAYPVLGESFTIRKRAGMVISLTGVGIIMYPKFNAEDLSELVAILLVCFSTVALAGGTVAYKRYAAQAPALWINAWSTLFGALILVPVALLLDDITAIRWNMTLLSSIVYLVFAVSIGAMLLWFWLIRSIGAGKASMLHLLNPPLGLFLAWLLLGEIPAYNELVGVLPVTLGILLVVWDS